VAPRRERAGSVAVTLSRSRSHLAAAAAGRARYNLLAVAPFASDITVVFRVAASSVAHVAFTLTCTATTMANFPASHGHLQRAVLSGKYAQVSAWSQASTRCHLQRSPRYASRDGEIEEATTEDGKNKAAVELGRKGGLARAKSVNRADRIEIARKAAKARWK
jgi:hypothetical protein